VPYPAGGSTDVLARILAERLNNMFGQPFVIENRPGAGGNIGIAAVIGSPPDGYTMGAATVGHFAINQFLYKDMPYDPEKDMIPASMIWELPNVFVVASDHVPATTLAEFIAWAKQKGHVSFGSPGVGTSPHLSGVLFAKRAELDAVHVPFRGAAQTIPAMLSGAVDFAIDNLASYISLIQSGKMRALAVTSAQRWPTLPDVPTMAEAGMKDFVVTSWGLSCCRRQRRAPSSSNCPKRWGKSPPTRICKSGFWWPAPASFPARRSRPLPLPPRNVRCGKTLSRSPA
jgi:tripartite-type tricarboxylate transporter receptor subunit TctC